jgi:formylglycine-generating enzyme required for sulfatase activity
MTGAGLNWYEAVEKLLISGKRLLTYQEFIQAAMGSPPGTSSGNLNAWTASAERTFTGFVERAVSSIGCRDCVGNVWEWLSDLIASGSGTEMWQDSMPGQGFGQMWLFENNNVRALLAGGSHFNGSLCGARTAAVLYTPWGNHASFGARGACEGL